MTTTMLIATILTFLSAAYLITSGLKRLIKQEISNEFSRRSKQ